MLTLTLSSISLTHNKQLEKYNEMVRTKTYRWNLTNANKGSISIEIIGFNCS